MRRRMTRIRSIPRLGIDGALHSLREEKNLTYLRDKKLVFIQWAPPNGSSAIYAIAKSTWLKFAIFLLFLWPLNATTAVASAEAIFLPIIFGVGQASTSAATADTETADTETVVVQLIPGADPNGVAHRQQAILLDQLPALHIYRYASQNPQLVARLSVDPQVRMVELENKFHAFRAQSRTFSRSANDFAAIGRYFSFGSGEGHPGDAPPGVEETLVVPTTQPFEERWRTWWQQETNTDRAHRYVTGAGVTVAVLDTGVDLDHPALAGRLLPGYDFVENDDAPDDTATGVDEDGNGFTGVGHGTHVAGSIAAIAPGARILPVRVLDGDGGGLLFDILAGMNFAISRGAQVINLSMSTPEDSPLLRAAIDDALARNIIVVAAASGAAGALEYPAAYDGVIAVGATRVGGQATDFSSPLVDIVDVLAPGEMIYGPYANGGYAWWSGSSMAAPVVTGEAALLLERGACVPTCVVNAITNNVITTQGPGKQIDAYKAIIHSQGATPHDGVCLLVIDKRALTKDIKSIEAAAKGHSVSADWLVNADRAGESGNPWLRWNEAFPGDRILLPGGQVDGEGWYALPAQLPWSLQAFVDGAVPQSKLDKIANVTPLSNQDLVRLVGRTCVAIAYESAISMNYGPANANLQGKRYGKFAFTVLGVELAGSSPESGSSTSLYSLWVRVEPPLHFTYAFAAPVRQNEPASIQFKRATYSQNRLVIAGISGVTPGSVLRVSIDGRDAGTDFATDPFFLEAPLLYNAAKRQYEFVFTTGENLRGRRITVVNDQGGVYNGRLP